MSPKLISVQQPVYLPWLGHFEQMARADHFIFYDDVQYTKQDWRNRNRIAGAQGAPVWLTVPIRRAPLATQIKDIEIENRQPWARKHLKSIALTYARAPYFDACYAVVEPILQQEWTRLVDLDIALTMALAGMMGIDTDVSRSSNTPTGLDDSVQGNARRNMRLVELCQHHGADGLYTGASAIDYTDHALFAGQGIKVAFQNYQHPRYPRPGPAHDVSLSAIDLLMHTGPDARDILLGPPPPEFHRL